MDQSWERFSKHKSLHFLVKYLCFLLDPVLTHNQKLFIKHHGAKVNKTKS